MAGPAQPGADDDCWAIARAWAIGMTNPMLQAWVRWLLEATAVLMPTTSPAALASGPPELPELIAASVWMQAVEVALLGVDRPAERRDDALGDRRAALEGEGVADGHDRIADGDVAAWRTSPARRRSASDELQHGDVVVGVDADDRGRALLAVHGAP